MKNKIQVNWILIGFFVVVIILFLTFIGNDDKSSLPTGELYYGGPQTF